MRRKYVPLYIRALQNQQMGGDEETRSMDAQLPETTILLFRRLAHAQVGLRERAQVKSLGSRVMHLSPYIFDKKMGNVGVE